MHRSQRVRHDSDTAQPQFFASWAFRLQGECADDILNGQTHTFIKASAHSDVGLTHGK